MKIYTIPMEEFQMNCYILDFENGECVVVDPGYHGDKLAGQMTKLGLTPKAILLTHGHYDHIGGLADFLEIFPETAVYIGEQELPVVKDMRQYLKDEKSADIIKNQAHRVEDGEIIKAVEGVEIKVMHTPGHTQGSVVYLIDDSMFSGDTLFYHEIGRCDLYTGNYDTMLKTLKKLAGLDYDYFVFPGHDQSTTLEEEKAHNKYFKLALSQ